MPCRGTVRTPGEKSISHRSVLLAALAEGTSVVHGLSDGADVAASLAAVEAMGVDRRAAGRRRGRARRRAQPAPCARTHPLDCGNSGTSMRLLAGLVAGLPWVTELIGDDSLSARPMDRVAEPLGLMGAGRRRARATAACPRPRCTGAAWCTASTGPPTVASAQVKSAILLAGLSAQRRRPSCARP